MPRRKAVPLDLPVALEKYKNRAAWEAARNSDSDRIGASDVPNLWGLGYSSPLSLWRELLRRRHGEAPDPIEPDLARRFALGAYLEPYVCDLARQEIGTGQVYSAADLGLAYHRALPDDDPMLPPEITRRVAVTLDGVVVEEGGEIVPLELKTVDVGASAGWPLDRPHPAAALQAATQAIVLKASHAYVFAMVGYGTGERSRRLYRVNVPPGFVDELARRLGEFFGYVEAGAPPEAGPQDHETIKAMFPAAAPGKTIWLPQGLARTIIEREDKKSQMSVLDKEVSALDAQIKLAMRDAETGVVQGTDLAVSYPTITKTEPARPEPRVSTYRRLSIRQATTEDLQRAIEPGEEEHG